MGSLTDNAFETDAVILNETIGLYAGSSTPEVDAPDAPEGSVYYRSNGQRFTRTQNTGSGEADDWVIEDPEGTGGGAAVQLSWRFSTTITEANPGSKRLRFDNATPASVTKIFVNDTTNNNFDASALLNALSSGDRIYVQESTDATAFFLATVTGVTDNTGWFTIDVTPLTVGALPSNNKDVGVLLIFGGGGGGTPGDQAIVQARRTTTQAFTLAWVDVPCDATDDENQPTVVEHDNTNTDRLILHEIGPYEIEYSGDVDVPVQGNFASRVMGRVRENDNTVIPGSESHVTALDDSSLAGDQSVEVPVAKKFFYTSTIVDEFVTVQIQRTDSSGTPTINLRADGFTFKAKRLSGEVGPAGPAGADKIYRVGKTYAIGGEIKVPVGQTDILVPFFVSLASGQTAKLVKVRYQLQAGTSATVDVEINGSGATGFTGISVTTTPAETDPADVVLSDNDEIAIVVTGVSGTPQNMTFTLFLEHTQ